MPVTWGAFPQLTGEAVTVFVFDFTEKSEDEVRTCIVQEHTSVFVSSHGPVEAIMQDSFELKGILLLRLTHFMQWNCTQIYCPGTNKPEWEALLSQTSWRCTSQYSEIVDHTPCFVSQIKFAQSAHLRLKTLRHPNIIRYIDGVEVRGTPVIPRFFKPWLVSTSLLLSASQLHLCGDGGGLSSGGPPRYEGRVLWVCHQMGTAPDCCELKPTMYNSVQWAEIWKEN